MDTVRRYICLKQNSQMRGNLPKREPEILKFWEDNKIYQKRLELRKDAKAIHFA